MEMTSSAPLKNKGGGGVRRKIHTQKPELFFQIIRFQLRFHKCNKLYYNHKQGVIHKRPALKKDGGERRELVHHASKTLHISCLWSP